jgi:acyl-coenzyme A synthetase/AMP-(fatty) acid ligase
LFWTLATGGRLVVAAEGYWQRLDELAGTLEQLGVTHLLCVPSVHRALLDAAPAATLGVLDTVIVAGEACPATLIDRHRAVLPGTRLVNEYGPTEATVWATACDLTAEPAAGAGPVPIGTAVGHVSVHLVDERLSPVPDGAVGEILIGGAGVARGYAGSPALTAERFVADPFGAEPGGRLYRTGDLARRRPDGALEFLGRGDQQVKVNGVRIELGEIESALVGHPDIREAAVLAAGPHLTAYVTVEGGAALSAADMRGFLATKLPASMLPAGYVVLPDLPRNGNDKVDRGALAGLRHPESPAAGADPLSAIQRSIAQIWAEVLDRQVSSIGVDQNFFDAGGQSLLLLRVRRQLERVLGRSVAVTTLLAHPTVGGLARHLSGTAAEHELPPQPRAPGRAAARPRRRADRRAG